MERLCIDNRLAVVAKWVLPDEIMADIGTDHAYLPCWLVLNGRCPAAIASDVAEGPFLQAKRMVADFGLTDRISLRRGSGLSVLKPSEAATVVLAGMGGQLICELLDMDRETAASSQRLILQPQRRPESVREWLMRNGWRIVADDVALDGKMWYNIIVAEQGTMELDEAGLLYGIKTPDVSSDLRRDWLTYRRKCLVEIAGQLRGYCGKTAAERLTEIEKEVAELDSLINEVETC